MFRTIVYFVAFVFFYVILSATTAIFLMTWGSKPTILKTVYGFFIGSPFNWSNSLWFLPINGLFWAIVFYLIFKAIQYVANRKRHTH